MMKISFKTEAQKVTSDEKKRPSDCTDDCQLMGQFTRPDHISKFDLESSTLKKEKSSKFVAKRLRSFTFLSFMIVSISFMMLAPALAGSDFEFRKLLHPDHLNDHVGSFGTQTQPRAIKVAFFDADFTLRISKTPGRFSPQSAQDQVLLPNVSETLRRLNEAGYLIAIVSNQRSTASSWEWNEQRLIFRDLAEKLRLAGARVDYVSIGGFWQRDHQKPQSGSFTHLDRLLNERGLKIDRHRSFIVGDAGFTADEFTAVGDKPIPDFASFDRGFAKNAGIRFFHARDFFSAPVATDTSLGWTDFERELVKSRAHLAGLEQSLEAIVQKPDFAQNLENFRTALTRLDQTPLDGLAVEFSALESRLDELIIEEYKALVELTWLTRAEIERTLKSNSNRVQFELLRPALDRLSESKARFDDATKNYGSGKDFKRFNAFRDYLIAYQNVLDLSGVTGLYRNSRLLRGLDTLRELFRDLIQSLRIGVRLVGPALKLMHATLLQTRSAKGSTPITTAATGLFHKWGEISGLKTELIGQENRPKERPGEVNIYLPNHTDAFLDMYVTAALGLKSYITVGALNLKGTNIFSLATVTALQPLIKRIQQNDHFILLGQGEPGLERLIAAFKENKSPNLLIFSQGMVSLGLEETNPIRDGLPRLIQELHRAGLKVNLVPVVMPDNSRFMSQFDRGFVMKSDYGDNLRVEVGKVIEDSALRFLEQNGKLELINSFVRSWWLSHLRTDSSRVAGMRRFESTLKELRKRDWLPSEGTRGDSQKHCSILF